MRSPPTGVTAGWGVLKTVAALVILLLTLWAWLGVITLCLVSRSNHAELTDQRGDPSVHPGTYLYVSGLLDSAAAEHLCYSLGGVVIGDYGPYTCGFPKPKDCSLGCGGRGLRGAHGSFARALCAASQDDLVLYAALLSAFASGCVRHGLTSVGGFGEVYPDSRPGGYQGFGVRPGPASHNQHTLLDPEAASSAKNNKKYKQIEVLGSRMASVSRFRLFRAFLNGLWGSASNLDDVVSNSPEGERVDAVKRYWYNHRRNQRSGPNQNPRSVVPPLGGWRPRSPRISFWGRTLASDDSEEFVDLESGCADDVMGDETTPLLVEPSEDVGAPDPGPDMNVELVTPSAPKQFGSRDSPDLSGPGPEVVPSFGASDEARSDRVRMKLFRVNINWAALSCGQEWLVLPLVGGEEANIAFSLGFRSYRWVEIAPGDYESAYQKIAGMRVTSGHTIDAIRYQCQTLGADLEELPRALLQRLMFCRVRDNLCGAGETGVSVGTLNSLAPGSRLLASFVRWLLMSPWLFLMSTIFFLLVLIRGVARVLSVAISRRSLRAVRTDRELSDIGRSLVQLFVTGVLSMTSMIVLLALVAIGCFTIRWVWRAYMRDSLVYLVHQAVSLGRDVYQRLRRSS